MAEGKAKHDIEYEPLDTLQIIVNGKNGIQTAVSAIHIGFMETKQYIQFKMPPTALNDTGQSGLTAEEEEWLECALFLEEDLHWVLKLPYNRFWSQVVYDEGLHKCLESYLSHALRDYDLINLHIKDPLLSSLKSIHKLIFLVYLRMSTYKESKQHHIRPEAFGSLIYDNFLFDVPKIMDLCVLYGMQNLALVTKMVLNIFSSQPSYNDDLNKTAQIVLEAFSTIEEKLSTNIPDLHRDSSNYQENGVNNKKQFTLSSLHDIINYVTDVSATLHAFLEVYSPACQTFFQNGAAVRIATFYENTFSAIEAELTKKSKESGSERILKDIRHKTNLSQTLLIKIFRNILNYSCIRRILNSDPSRTTTNIFESSPSDQFLEIFTEIATEKNFLHDYNAISPFETDIELFNELGLNLDQQRLSYIFSSIHDNVDVLTEKFMSSVENGARPKLKKKESSHVKSLQEVANVLREGNSNDNLEFADSNESSRNPYKNGLSEEKISSMIHSVLDILPELGEGFVEKCLQNYNHDPERVIDAIFTNSLPEHLVNLDRNLNRDVSTSTQITDYPILAERKNIYDNDEFDLFRRDDVNMKNIHIGKKNKTPTTYQALDKDEQPEYLKKLILDYANRDSGDEEVNLYEDEYDDTYDSAMIGLKEPGSEDVLDNEPANDKTTEETEPVRDTSRDFCINPEVLREKQQQRREAKFAKRGGGPPPEQSRNRQLTDRNKAYVGNHNRRKQSDFKRSRGMIP